MITTKVLNIKIKVTFDDWEKESINKLTKEQLTEKVKNFVTSYFPMKQTTLGKDHGKLVIEFKTIN